MKKDNYELSVIVIVGIHRTTIKKLQIALKSQTVANQVELILVDMNSDCRPPIVIEDGLCVRVVEAGAKITYTEARLLGSREARGSIVAFLEDHCIPAQDWVESLIEAHQETWALVGYSFTNGSPDAFIYRITLLAEYGPWVHPVPSGPVNFLPDGNLSYKRDCLFTGDSSSIPEEETGLPTPDYYKKQGKELFLESRAKVAHQSCKHPKDTFWGHFCCSRILAAERIRSHSWTPAKRILFALGIPVVLPGLQILRLLPNIVKQRTHIKDFFIGLPYFYLLHQFAAIGESIGYLFGEGMAKRDLDHIELAAPRIGKK